MPEFSISNRHSRDVYLAPAKNLIVIGVVCALSAVALLAGRTRSPTSAATADKHEGMAEPSTDTVYANAL